MNLPESHERCGGNARRQTEDGMEALIIVPIGCSGNGIADGTKHDEKEIHHETHPYQQAPCGIPTLRTRSH